MHEVRRLEENGKPFPLVLKQPESGFQDADRLVLADVDLLVLRRDGESRIVAIADDQLGEIYPLVAVLFADAAKVADRHLFEQTVDGPLQIGPHTAGKAPLG